MANARKRKARKARRAVNRGDRVGATPETLAKLRPHPLEILLAHGREHGGIDADQLQCAEEIVDACDAVTRGLGVKAALLERIGTGGSGDELSPRDERLAALWFIWAAELRRRFEVRPFVILELISAVQPLDRLGVGRLTTALDLWAKVRHDSARREVSTKCPNHLDSAGAAR